MLILNSNDIYKACYLPDVIKAIEKAYSLQANNNYLMPDRLHLIIQDDIQLIMPSAAEGLFCSKLVTVNQKNTLRNLPIINGSVQLTRQSDGQLLSLMDGSALTAIRTGAVGAVAAKYLANENSRTVGLIGTGTQGLHLLWLISEVLQVDQFYIFNYKAQQTQKFKLDLKKKIPGVKTEVVNDREELVKLCDVIVTATTSSSPVLPEKPEILKGKLYICMGSFKPVMGELPRTIYPLVKNIYVDVDYARKESGDVSWPLKNNLLKNEDIVQMSEVILDEHKPKNGTRIFKSVGMALFDLTVSNAIYQSALDNKIGMNISL